MSFGAPSCSAAAQRSCPQTKPDGSVEVFFVYQKRKFAYNPETQTFVKPKFPIHNTYGTYLANTGYHNSEDVEAAQLLYGSNTQVSLSVGRLDFAELIRTTGFKFPSPPFGSCISFYGGVICSAFCCYLMCDPSDTRNMHWPRSLFSRSSVSRCGCWTSTGTTASSRSLCFSSSREPSSCR